MPFDLHRLEYQVSSLEKELLLSQQNVVRAETQLTEVQSKYDATPKQEVIDRYVYLDMHANLISIPFTHTHTHTHTHTQVHSGGRAAEG